LSSTGTHGAPPVPPLPPIDEEEDEEEDEDIVAGAPPIPPAASVPATSTEVHPSEYANSTRNNTATVEALYMGLLGK